MKKNKMCSFTGNYEYVGPAKVSVSYYEVREMNVRPPDKVRVKCPECKRRIFGQMKYCDDGCCTFIRVPPHKRKGWWKKPKLRKKRATGRFR